ncbi:MAG TPA: energy transducer TonB, partial [Pyrinomonadaceae bacterium]|nr:energy transducer TonB [Pyrinomonadaceae bacterium]
MFNNLIESGSHGRDLKRKGSFFIGTFLFYTVLLTVAGVGSIYAYNVRLDAQNDYELTLIRFPAATEKAEPQKPRAQPKSAAANSGGKQQIATIRHLVVNTPLPGREVAPENARVLAPGTIYKFGPVDHIPPASNIGGLDKGISHGLPDDRGQPRVTEEVEAPDVKVVKPTPTPEPPRRPEGPVRVASSVLTGKAISKPAPPYPPIAKQARQAGVVAVQIVVDEQGRVVSAKA